MTRIEFNGSGTGPIIRTPAQIFLESFQRENKKRIPVLNVLGPTVLTGRSNVFNNAGSCQVIYERDSVIRLMCANYSAWIKKSNGLFVLSSPGQADINLHLDKPIIIGWRSGVNSGRIGGIDAPFFEQRALFAVTRRCTNEILIEALNYKNVIVCNSLTAEPVIKDMEYVLAKNVTEVATISTRKEWEDVQTQNIIDGGSGRLKERLRLYGLYFLPDGSVPDSNRKPLDKEYFQLWAKLDEKEGLLAEYDGMPGQEFTRGMNPKIIYDIYSMTIKRHNMLIISQKN